jgi:type VI secretion system secreted protein VgrG
MTVAAGTVSLDAGGDSNAVWIFQTASELVTSPYTTFVLRNGAQAKNVFWKVGSSTTLGYSSTFVGTILAYSSISVDMNTSVNGRTLAGAGVSFAGNDFIAVPAN